MHSQGPLPPFSGRFSDAAVWTCWLEPKVDSGFSGLCDDRTGCLRRKPCTEHGGTDEPYARRGATMLTRYGGANTDRDSTAFPNGKLTLVWWMDAEARRGQGCRVCVHLVCGASVSTNVPYSKSCVRSFAACKMIATRMQRGVGRRQSRALYRHTGAGSAEDQDTCMGTKVHAAGFRTC